jgi:predicted dehydrogenase
MPAATRSSDGGPRLRIGVAGAGLIAQVEHLPNLVALPDRFDLVAVADPSAAVRDAVAGRYGVRAHADVEALLGERLDAIVVAVPDALHAGTVLHALEAGLHVLCEKPLCIDDADYARIAEARDRAGRVVQVGYMKRFDPNYEAALAELPGDGASTLRYLSVEVHDPDAWPFVAHRPLTRADDVPPALGEETRAALHRQAVAALGVEPAAEALAGFTNTLMSGVVHCVNAGHGLLDRMGVPDGEVVGGAIWREGEGAAGEVRLLGGRAHWRFCQVLVPHVALYRERYSLWFDDRIVELEFPAPYLNHQQTRLTVLRSDGRRLESRTVAAGFEEAFVRELEGFHDAICGVAAQRNPVEEARRDARLLRAVALQAMAPMRAASPT